MFCFLAKSGSSYCLTAEVFPKAPILLTNVVFLMGSRLLFESLAVGARVECDWL